MQNMSLVLLLVVVCGATLSEGLSLGRGSLSMIGSKKKVCWQWAWLVYLHAHH